MNLETNCGPRSEIICLGSPKRQKMWLRKSCAKPLELRVTLVGMKRGYLVNLSMTVRIALCPHESGNGPMRSIDIVSHGIVGISCGWSGADRFPLWILFR